MTLIIAFPLKHGSIIGADSQETVKDPDGTEWKYSVLKIRPERIGNFTFCVSGSGNGEGIESFIEKLKRALAKSRAKTINAFRVIFENELRKEVSELVRKKQDSTMQFIVAVHIAKEYELWRTASHTLIKIDEHKPCLVGFTSHLYQHMADSMFRVNLPAIESLVLGLYILELARQTCTCVDLPYSAVIVSGYEIRPLEDKLLEELTESIKLFGASANRLLLACANTQLTTREFITTLCEFRATTYQLRKEYFQTIGEMEFRNILETGLGFGIPFTPFGTVSTGRYDKITGLTNVTIKEDTKLARIVGKRIKSKN